MHHLEKQKGPICPEVELGSMTNLIIDDSIFFFSRKFSYIAVLIVKFSILYSIIFEGSVHPENYVAL